MICNNCGHDNQPGVKACVLCNFPLAMQAENPAPKPQPPAPPGIIIPSIDQSKEPEPRSARTSNEETAPLKGKKTCPQCRYELILDSDQCPMCSYSFITKEAPKMPKDNVPVMPSGKVAESKDRIQQEEPPERRKSEKPESKPTTSPFLSIKDKSKGMASTIDPFRRDTPNNATASLKPISRAGESDLEPIPVVFTDQAVPLNRQILEPGNNTITSKIQAEIEYRDGEWYLVDRSEQQTTFIRAIGSLKLNKGDVILMGNRKFIFDC